MADYNSLIYRMLKIPLDKAERIKIRNLTYRIINDSGTDIGKTRKILSTLNKHANSNISDKIENIMFYEIKTNNTDEHMKNGVYKILHCKKI